MSSFRDKVKSYLAQQVKLLGEALYSRGASYLSFHYFYDEYKVYSLTELVGLFHTLMSDLIKYPPYTNIPDWECSPVILVDVDGTLFKKYGDPLLNHVHFGEPVQEVIDTVNELYDAGAIVRVYTGRMNAFILFGDINYKLLLESELKRIAVKYNDIITIQKPNFTLLIDDKSINPLL